MSEGTSTETEDQVIGRFQKSNSASIQVTVVEWQGNDYLDIREVVPGDTGFTFTKKGVRIRKDLVSDLQGLLAQVSSEKQEEGPGPGADGKR